MAVVEQWWHPKQLPKMSKHDNLKLENQLKPTNLGVNLELENQGKPTKILEEPTFYKTPAVGARGHMKS